MKPSKVNGICGGTSIIIIVVELGCGLKDKAMATAETDLSTHLLASPSGVNRDEQGV